MLQQNGIPFLLLISATISSITHAAEPSLENTAHTPIFATVDEDLFIDCKVESIANYTLLWRRVKPSAKEDDFGEVLTAGKLRVSPDTRLNVLHGSEDGE